MLRAHKIALDPNNKQKTHLSKCAGASRFAYNWALAEWNAMHEARKEDPSLKRPGQGLLRRKLNATKRERFPWMLEVTKCAPQEAIIDLGRAFSNFFEGLANHPTFKKKGINDSFRISSGFFTIEGKTLAIPHIGSLRMREELRYQGARQVSVTISRRADRWHASILCELPDTAAEASLGPPPGERKTVGIDAGVSAYVASDGTAYKTPRAYRKAERKLARAQKSESRKKKGSKNRKKQGRKVARQHARVYYSRNDFTHKMTTDAVAGADVIVIEDLNVKGMLGNRRLSKSIADASFGEFRIQLAYKAEAAGKTLVIADRHYPSSKLCSACGAKAKLLTLGMREWECEGCGARHDRDLNAATNLKRYAESSPASACGEFNASAMPAKAGPGQAASVKQEPNSKPTDV